MTSGKVMGWILGIAAGSLAILAVSDGAVALGVAALIGLGIAGLGLYLFPAIVANMREHPNRTSITVLNVLLGWTLVGWVVSMVWAVSAIAEPSDSTKEQPATTDPAQPSQAVAPSSDEKACPFCAEMVKQAAVKCKHCGSEIPA